MQNNFTVAMVTKHCEWGLFWNLVYTAMALSLAVSLAPLL